MAYECGNTKLTVAKLVWIGRLVQLPYGALGQALALQAALGVPDAVDGLRVACLEDMTCRALADAILAGAQVRRPNNQDDVRAFFAKAKLARRAPTGQPSPHR